MKLLQGWPISSGYYNGGTRKRHWKKNQIKLILHSDMLVFLCKKQEKKNAFKAKLN
jgi:hypothetical protein